MSLKIVLGYDREEEVIELFAEYTKLLMDTMPIFGEYLKLQNYSSEEKHPGTKYAEPMGRLYLAYWDGQLAGCAALRQIDGQRAELKRMYVRPEFRGKHISRALVNKIIGDAREIGYACILLDTEPCLDTAIRLYLSAGFKFTERYNDSPFDTTLFMKYML